MMNNEYINFRFKHIRKQHINESLVTFSICQKVIYFMTTLKNDHK